MPETYDVIVIGGGPAGSTSAGLLAKWGRRVLVIDKEKFPRYHIGESLVPGLMTVIEELGATEIVEAAGATKKYGATLLWGKGYEPWSISFDEVSAHPYAFEVKRAEFDNLLLSHARTLGATVIEEATVRAPLFDGDRCVGVRYSTGRSDEAVEAHAPIVIDASGQAKLLARHLDTVNWHEDLKNLAAWSYFQGGQRYEGRQAGNIVVENLPPGWLWLIPFSDGTCSVGFVAPSAEFVRTGLSPAEVLYDRIGASSEIKRLLTGAVEVAQVRTAKDWSYTSDRMSGPGYLMAGDSAAFVDPLFSTGVMLAMKSASAAARAAHAILEHPTEEEALLKEYEEAYRSFVGIILSFVRFFYDPDRDVAEYFNHARELIDPFEHMMAREDFIVLISGLHGTETVIEPATEYPATAS